MSAMRDYFLKMRGNDHPSNKISNAEIFWSWVGAFIGIGSVSILHYGLLPETDLMMVIGSFGASAVLLYGAPDSALSQPRNLIGGHLVSALIGVFAYQLLHEYMWLAAAFGVATSIAVMHITATLHPPGGATALIAVVGSDEVHMLGYQYVIIPVLIGAIIMLLVAIIVNNMAENRKYPAFWL